MVKKKKQIPETIQCQLNLMSPNKAKAVTKKNLLILRMKASVRLHEHFLKMRNRNYLINQKELLYKHLTMKTKEDPTHQTQNRIQR